jgi:hypothetical protein
MAVGGKLGNEVRHLLRRVLKASGFNALNTSWFHWADL